jgi:uncharacterized membrane protein
MGTEGTDMARIHKSIEIHAPIKNVFDYIDDPAKDPEWMTSMIEVKDITGTGIGKRFKWTYKMGGMKFNGESTFKEEIPEKKITVESRGGVESTWSFNFESHQDATVLDLDIDYKIPVPVLGNFAERLLQKRNEREAEMSLLNIKDNLESKA